MKGGKFVIFRFIIGFMGFGILFLWLGKVYELYIVFVFFIFLLIVCWRRLNKKYGVRSVFFL